MKIILILLLSWSIHSAAYASDNDIRNMCISLVKRALYFFVSSPVKKVKLPLEKIQSDDPIEQALAEVNSGWYEMDHCERNTQAVVHFAKNRGANLNNAKVLVFYIKLHNLRTGDNFWIYNPRFGKVRVGFHVVLENDGKIYDADYRLMSSVSSKRYFREILSRDDMQRIKVRTYSPQDYLRKAFHPNSVTEEEEKADILLQDYLKK